VPEEVSDFIGIPANDPLNYADQFDMPYMLKRSGSDVARELGALTNVSVIFEASREANRRRLASSGKLKTRASDYEALTTNLDAYRSLEQSKQAVAEAEKIYARAVETREHIAELDALVGALNKNLDIPASRDIPDALGVVQASKSLDHLTSLVSVVQESERAVEKHSEAVEQYQESAREAREAYAQALRDAGTCPVCGQETHGIHL
jgi:DNA repair exonuclease SbcCD ATPase subunit